MGLPGWSATEPATAGDMTLLPRSFRWASETVGVEDASIINETNFGYTTGYELFHRDVLPGLIFRFPKSEYDDFKAIHDYSRGKVRPFWFCPDIALLGASPLSGVLYVRKEVSFLPVNIGQPGSFGGSMQQWFDYTMYLTVEVADQPLLD